MVYRGIQFDITSFICHCSPWDRWGVGIEGIESGCLLHLLPRIPAQALGKVSTKVRVASAPPSHSRALLLLPPVLWGEGRLLGSQWSMLVAGFSHSLPSHPSLLCSISSPAKRAQGRGPRIDSAGSASAPSLRRCESVLWPRNSPLSEEPCFCDFGSNSDENPKCGMAATAVAVAAAISIETPETCSYLALPSAAAAADFSSASVEARKCGLGGSKLEAATVQPGV